MLITLVARWWQYFPCLRCFKFYLKHNLVNSAYFKPTDKDEIVNIINKFQKGKSLGPNSVPIHILKYNSEILLPILADHMPISIRIMINVEDDKGPGFFKFNNSLLNEKEYIKERK